MSSFYLSSLLLSLALLLATASATPVYGSPKTCRCTPVSSQPTGYVSRSPSLLTSYLGRANSLFFHRVSVPARMSLFSLTSMFQCLVSVLTPLGFPSFLLFSFSTSSVNTQCYEITNKDTGLCNRRKCGLSHQCNSYGSLICKRVKVTKRVVPTKSYKYGESYKCTVEYVSGHMWMPIGRADGYAIEERGPTIDVPRMQKRYPSGSGESGAAKVDEPTLVKSNGASSPVGPEYQNSGSYRTAMAAATEGVRSANGSERKRADSTRRRLLQHERRKARSARGAKRSGSGGFNESILSQLVRRAREMWWV